jgi:YD repeat-containing protein
MRRLPTRARTSLVLLLTIAVTTLGLAVPPLPQAAASAGAEPVRYAYDDVGRLVGVTDPAGDTAAYAYDETGNLTGITRHPSA